MSVSWRRIVTPPPDGRDRARRHRASRAVVAREVAGRRLDVDARDVDAEQRGDRRPHRVEAAPEARSRADDGDVDRRRAQPGGGEAPTTSPRSAALSTPRGVRSSLGKSRPRSPSPAAPSSASATAWRTTSPSEWPASAGAPGIAIPPIRSGEPGPKGWLSWPNPTRAPSASSCRSTRSRSSGSVTLRLVGWPGIAWTVMVQASSRAASSVNSRSPSGGYRSQASRSRRRRAPCGVWAAASVLRSTVSTTRSPSMRFSVSATDSTGIAAPCRSTASAIASTSATDTSGRAPSWTRTGRSPPAGSVRWRWRTPAATDAWRVVPPATTSVPAGQPAGGRDLVDALGGDDDDHPVDGGRCGQRGDRPGEQRAPADRAPTACPRRPSGATPRRRR